MKEGKMLMEKEDMFRQIEEFILSNGLSVVGEYKLWSLLENRINGREKCLASVIDKEIREYEDDEHSFGEYRDFYLNISRKCFWETETGSMEAAVLSSKIIEEFIIEMEEQYGLGENEKYAFMQMLQIGLNKLDDEGILKFSPDRLMFRKFAASKSAVSFIRNPYSEAETEKIMEWAKAIRQM